MDGWMDVYWCVFEVVETGERDLKILIIRSFEGTYLPS